jgi:hypothetical protein
MTTHTPPTPEQDKAREKAFKISALSYEMYELRRCRKATPEQ